MSGNIWARAIDLASVAGIAIGLFATLRVLRSPRRANTSDRLLGLLLFLCTANIAHGTIDFHPRSGGGILLEPFQFILPLGIAWYVRSLRGLRFFKPQDAVFFALPFLFIAASYLPAAAVRLPSGLNPFSLAMWVTMAVSATLLLVPVARDLHEYRRGLKDEFSNLAGLDAGWLAAILLLMAGLFSMYALLTVLLIHAPSDFPERKLLAALMAVFTVFFAWKALGRAMPERKAARPIAAEDGAEAELRSVGERVRACIEEGRLFLDPELSLEDLARAAGLRRHHVSAAINRGLGTTFFDLVNGFRVREFQRLCLDPARRDDKIVTLALDAGFNSKPAFNAVFKRATGNTPSRYRQIIEIESRPIA